MRGAIPGHELKPIPSRDERLPEAGHCDYLANAPSLVVSVTFDGCERLYRVYRTQIEFVPTALELPDWAEKMPVANETRAAEQCIADAAAATAPAAAASSTGAAAVSSSPPAPAVAVRLAPSISSGLVAALAPPLLAWAVWFYQAEYVALAWRYHRAQGVQRFFFYYHGGNIADVWHLLPQHPSISYINFPHRHRLVRWDWAPAPSKNGTRDPAYARFQEPMGSEAGGTGDSFVYSRDWHLVERGVHADVALRVTPLFDFVFTHATIWTSSRCR